MTKKLDINYIKAYIESFSYKLINEEYLGSQQKLDLICPKLHKCGTTFNNFKSKAARCITCAGTKRFTLEEVQDRFFKEGYTLLTKEYENAHQKLETKCPKGHPYNVSLDSFNRSGSRCPECQGIKRYTLKDVENILILKGYKLISKYYRNARQRLEAVCPKGHKTTVTLNGFMSNNCGCFECFGNMKYTIEEIRETLQKEAYILLSTSYGGVHSHLMALCPNGHNYKFTFANFKNHRRRCPKCTKRGESRAEIEILNWFKEMFPSATKHRVYFDETNKKRFVEFDTYIPEIKLAVEHTGMWWHSDKYKEKNFHKDKLDIAQRYGIRLITIFEDEWLEKKDQIKNFLLSVANKNSTRIGARKTEIKEVPKIEARSFLDNNHIQGSTTFMVAFGLYYEKELVGLISGNKHHRQGQNNIFVLNRLVFKNNITISGGSSKLLKELKKYAKDNGYSKLISWSDNRFSEGNVYLKLGFQMAEELPIDYSYVNNHGRFSKQSCQKKSLIKRGAMGNTETEMALSLGLYKLWDCGKKRWEINL